MARRLILDTNVLVRGERSGTLSGLIEPEDDIAIAAISVAEMRAGALLGAPSKSRQRHAFLERLLEIVPVEPYTADVASLHGNLLAHTRREGRTRGVADLMIAATALATDRVIVSGDRAADFAQLPGVQCLPLDPDQTVSEEPTLQPRKPRRR